MIEKKPISGDLAGEDKVVQIEYLDSLGEPETRAVIPVEIHFGLERETAEMEWQLRAYDLEQQTIRNFPLKAIVSWNPKKARVASLSNI